MGAHGGESNEGASGVAPTHPGDHRVSESPAHSRNRGTAERDRDNTPGTGETVGSGPSLGTKDSPTGQAEEKRGPIFTWRSIILLAMAVAALVVGWQWKQDSDTPTDSLVRKQLVQVFVSDPRAHVQLTATYPSLDSRTRLENLYLSIVPPASAPREDVQWALVGVDHSIGCVAPTLGDSSTAKPLPSALVFGTEPNKPAVSSWLCMGDTTGDSFASLARLRTLSLPRVGPVGRADPYASQLTEGALVASIPIQGLDDQEPGAYFARLPALDLEPLPQPGVTLIVGLHHDGTQLQYVLNEDPKPRQPALTTSPDLGSYDQAPGLLATLPVAFFAPENISTQSLLEMTNNESKLAKYKSDQNNPSDGAFANGGYLWTGHGFIEPTVSLSDPSANDARSQDALLAGVALAVGASAAIAFLQELPRARRRERGPRRRAGARA